MHPETLSGDATARRVLRAYRDDAKTSQRGARRRSAAYLATRALVRLIVLVGLAWLAVVGAWWAIVLTWATFG